jgi:hypothetical protein
MLYYLLLSSSFSVLGQTADHVAVQSRSFALLGSCPTTCLGGLFILARLADHLDNHLRNMEPSMPSIFTGNRGQSPMPPSEGVDYPAPTYPPPPALGTDAPFGNTINSSVPRPYSGPAVNRTPATESEFIKLNDNGDMICHDPKVNKNGKPRPIAIYNQFLSSNSGHFV